MARRVVATLAGTAASFLFVVVAGFCLYSVYGVDRGELVYVVSGLSDDNPATTTTADAGESCVTDRRAVPC